MKREEFVQFRIYGTFPVNPRAEWFNKKFHQRKPNISTPFFDLHFRLHARIYLARRIFGPSKDNFGSTRRRVHFNQPRGSRAMSVARQTAFHSLCCGACGRGERARKPLDVMMCACRAGCWLIDMCVGRYMFDRESATQVKGWIQDSLFMMAVSNSCMNPFVYGAYAMNFRQEFLRCVGCACCRKTKNDRILIGTCAPPIPLMDHQAVYIKPHTPYLYRVVISRSLTERKKMSTRDFAYPNIFVVHALRKKLSRTNLHEQI